MALTKGAVIEYLTNIHSVTSSEIGGETPLFSNGLIDSFAMIDLVSFIEQSLGTRMSPSDITLDNLDTVDRIVAFAETRV